MQKLHFISGLPRSGTTLLAAILKQNPAFSAEMMSPVARVYKGLEINLGPTNELSASITQEQRADVFRGLFESFYKRNPADVVFDNARLWLARMPAINQLFPDAKVICCVRDIAWIMDSFERLKVSNPLVPSGVYNFDNNGTVFDRAGVLANGSGLVGWSLNALREALAGEYREKILLVEYEDLCRDPATALKKIYFFLGQPMFKHDFENVQYSSETYDKQIGVPGLHTVSGKVEWRPRQTILPPMLFQSVAQDNFWRRTREAA